MENQRLRMEVSNFKNKVMSLEINDNYLQEYGRRNNLEITRIPDEGTDENLEEKIIRVLTGFRVNVSSSEIEACHRIGTSRNLSKEKKKRKEKKEIVKKQLYNLSIGNTPKKARINKKGPININKSYKH